MKSLEIILELGNLKIKDNLKKKYAAQKNDWYREYISRMSPEEILPGSIEFLKEIRNAGIMTGIGSISPPSAPSAALALET